MATKIDYASLPNYVKNYDACLDDSDATTEWVTGEKPDYSVVNGLYEREKTKVHTPGSLEDIVSNLIKNWEKELSHKKNPAQWLTVVPSEFRMAINGGPFKTLPELAKIGAYNAFLGNTEYYAAQHISDPHASHQVFRTALKSGFALEVLEVYAPPPKITFKFRHWGHMTGELKCPMRNGNILQLAPHNGKVEFIGIGVITVNDKYQIGDMELFFRPDTMMENMVHPDGK